MSGGDAGECERESANDGAQIQDIIIYRVGVGRRVVRANKDLWQKRAKRHKNDIIVINRDIYNLLLLGNCFRGKKASVRASEQGSQEFPALRCWRFAIGRNRPTPLAQVAPPQAVDDPLLRPPPCGSSPATPMPACAQPSSCAQPPAPAVNPNPSKPRAPSLRHPDLPPEDCGLADRRTETK